MKARINAGARSIEIPVLSTRSASKVYRGWKTGQTVLDRVSLDVFAGDFAVIMGPSGAGKSTLLHVMSGMDSVSKGTVLYKGTRIDSLGEKEMTRLRRHDFGFVFQQSQLVSDLTLLENVVVAGCFDGSRSARSTREHAARLLDRMGVGDARDRLPSHASGGEAQRASIARAIVNAPAMLFADEPTGSLNRAGTDGVLDLFTNLNEQGQGILMVTHDQRAALRGNRIIFLVDGSIAGELALPPYATDDPEARAERIGTWLFQMGW